MVWLFIAGLALADPPALGDRPAVAGDRVRLEHRTRVDLPLRATIGEREAPLRLSSQHDQRTEYRVEEVGPDGPARVQVSWQRSHLEDRGPDGSRSLDLPVAGNTYEVDLRAGSVVGAHTRAERDTALAASDLFALIAGIRAALGPGPPRSGESVPAPALFAGLVRDAPGTPTVTGRVIAGERALIDGVPCQAYTVQVQLDSEGELEPGVHVRMQARLRGTLHVEVETGWTRVLEVSGPVSVSGGGSRFGRSFTLGGEGQFDSRTRLTPAYAPSSSPPPARPAPSR